MEGQKLTDMEVLFNCFLLIIGGQETTRNALSGGMLALDGESRTVRALDRAKDRSLLPTTVEEFLRCTSPITHLMRTATKDAEMHGRKIKAGDQVVIWNASANRDEAQFPQPSNLTPPAGPTSMSHSAMASISASGRIWRGWNCG